jgi:hypothetical protein
MEAGIAYIPRGWFHGWTNHVIPDWAGLTATSGSVPLGQWTHSMWPKSCKIEILLIWQFLGFVRALNMVVWKGGKKMTWLLQVGSGKWLTQHGNLEKLNLQVCVSLTWNHWMQSLQRAQQRFLVLRDHLCPRLWQPAYPIVVAATSSFAYVQVQFDYLSAT